MKVLPADFFAKQSGLLVSLCACIASGALAQGYAPGMVERPQYRQPGSAYGMTTTAPPPYTYQGPPQPTSYQPSYATPPPPTYRPPPIKAPTSSTRKTTSKSTTQSKPKTTSSSLEHKVARLEKKEVEQDRRLNHLEGTPGRPVSSGSGRSYTSSGSTSYVVRPGDTLYRIADKHNTTISAIKSTNRLSSEVITVGQTLVIPGHGPVYTSSPSSSRSTASSYHTVRPGDTFSQIAQSYGVSMDSLSRANPSVHPDRVTVGSRLSIPGKSSSSISSIPSSVGKSTVSSSSRHHVVRRGESLGAIAKSYGVSTASLASANKLRNANLIEPGQRLTIPGGSLRSSQTSYPAADNYDVVPLPGTSLASYTPPSSAFKASSAPSYSAAEAPAPEMPPISKPAPAPAPQVSSNKRGILAYRLERGDDINTVSALFNTTPDKIREMNKLSSTSKLREGDEVVVPSMGAVSLN